MILLTLGTSKYQFIRLAKAVDKALIKNDSNDLLIAQVGSTNYNFNYQKTLKFKLMPFRLLKKYYKTSNWIISHGGAGSVLMALMYSKNKSFALAREKKFKEHVDNHQKPFLQYCHKNRFVFTSINNKNITNDIVRFLKNKYGFPQKKYIFSPNKLTDNMIGFTNNMWRQYK